MTHFGKLHDFGWVSPDPEDGTVVVPTGHHFYVTEAGAPNFYVTEAGAGNFYITET